MRTDVKVGVALSAVVLIIAVSYYGTKKQPEDVQLADAADKVRDQNARTLDGLLSPGSNQSGKADKDKKPGETARPAGAIQQRPRPRSGNTTGTPAPASENLPAARTNPIRPPVLPAQNNTDSTTISELNKPASKGPTLEQSSVMPASSSSESAREPAPMPSALRSETTVSSGNTLTPISTPAGSSSPAVGSGPSNFTSQNDPSRQSDGVAQSTPGIVSPGPTQLALTGAGTAGNTKPSSDPTKALPPLRTPAQNQALTPPKTQQAGLVPAGHTGGVRNDVGASAAPAPPPAGPRNHVIASGDSFAKLAEHYYGSQKHMRVLVAANPAVDPKAMKIGTTITIPPLTDATKPEARSQKPIARSKPGPGQLEYTVLQGDTLYTIAEKHLGSGNRWPEVYELNKEEVGSDPMTLQVGNIILLPTR